MKGDGLYRRGEVWWMTWRTPDGKRHRASTGKRYYADGKAERDRIVGDMAHGRPVAAPRRVTLEELRPLIEADYTAKGNRSVRRVKGALKHLRAHFGRQPIAGITWGDTVEYRKRRMEQGRAAATINYELAVLRRMLRLAVKDGKLWTAPLIETPDPRNARSGFFEADDFDAVVEHLPDAYAAVARFAYFTGWRVQSEVLRLTWPQVDFAAGVVRLEPGTTKNAEGREFPFTALPALAELMQQRRAVTDAVIREIGRRVPWVFHEGGRPIPYKKLLSVWWAAFDAAEVEPRYLHDLRRTAVRNLERAGVSRSVAMKLTGHKTEAIYRRYAIAPARDLREGVEKLARVTIESQSDASADSHQS